MSVKFDEPVSRDEWHEYRHRYALHYVVQRRDVAGVERLLPSSSRLERVCTRWDVNKLDHKGFSPLLYAAYLFSRERGVRPEGEHVRLNTMLLEAGADPNECGPGGYSPLYCAARQGSLGVVRKLLDFSADPRLADQDGSTPLLVAAHQGHMEVCAVLLGALQQDPAAQWALLTKHDHKGRAPLYFALRCGHPHLLKLFMQMGADPSAHRWPKTKSTGAQCRCLERVEKEAKVYNLVRLYAMSNGCAGVVVHCKSQAMRALFEDRRARGKLVPKILWEHESSTEKRSNRKNGDLHPKKAPKKGTAVPPCVLTAGVLRKIVALPNELFVELLGHWTADVYTPGY